MVRPTQEPSVSSGRMPPHLLYSRSSSLEVPDKRMKNFLICYSRLSYVYDSSVYQVGNTCHQIVKRILVVEQAFSMDQLEAYICESYARKISHDDNNRGPALR